MAPRPQDDDPRVTDLRRYRKAREQAARRRAQQKPNSESFIGSNPRAGVILVLVILVIVAFYVIPRFL